MINTRCLSVTPELRELNKEFPKMPISIFKQMVSMWQGEYGKDIDTYPAKEDLISFIPKVNSNWNLFIDPKEVKVANISADNKENFILSNFSKRPFVIEYIADGTREEQILLHIFYPVLEYEDQVFSSVEQAFQFLKMSLPLVKEVADADISEGDREKISKARYITERIMSTTDPGIIRRLGNTRGVLTDDEAKLWDSDSRAIMKALIRQSLLQSPKALQALLNTGDSVLTHIQGDGKWKIQFPAILEELRSELKDVDISKIKDVDTDSDTTSEKSTSATIDEKSFHIADSVYTTGVKLQRIGLINRLFSQEVERLQEATSTRLNAEMLKADTLGKKLEIAKAIKNLRPYVVIKQENPVNIYNKIRKMFEDSVALMESNMQYAIDKELQRINTPGSAEYSFPDTVKQNLARTWANHKLNEYRKMLANWDSLVRDAAVSYGYDYKVVIDIDTASISEDTIDDSINDEGTNLSEEAEDMKEETPYKEGWQVKVRELSAFESMTNMVRQAISKINRTDRDGNVITDDLGYPQGLQSSYVFAELITSLKDMTNARQMLPMLESLQTRKPWASQVVNAVRNDDRLFTSFYRVFRKDYLNLWVQSEKTGADGRVTVKTFNINKPSGTAHYFDEWRDNIEYGITLDNDSVYNHNGEVVLSNAEKGLRIVDDILDRFRGVSDKVERQQIILDSSDDIYKVLSMLGVSVTKNTLRDVLEHNVDPDNKMELPGSIVLSNLRTIFSDMPKNSGITDGRPADLINMYGRAFNNIAYAINNVDEDEIESSVRQGKKTLYAHTRPSYATTLIKKLRGSEYQKYIDDNYKTVDFLYDKNQHRWLNSLINDIESDPEARNKLSHIVVIEHNRKPYGRWTPLDTFLTLYNQYNAEPFKGNEGYAWYQMPLLSDAESAEFIRAKRIRGTDYKERLLGKFADVIRQEYNRIVTVRKRNNTTDIEKIAYYDMSDNKTGGAKFLFFPELNNSEFSKDGKSFFDQLAEVADDTDRFNQIAKDAVNAIMNRNFVQALDRWASTGVFDRTDEQNDNSAFKYFNRRTRQAVESDLEEYYWNTTYMQSQIIQLMTTDLAYYGNFTNFTKRALEFHSPTEKLNTLAKWDGKYVLASEDADSNVTVRPERVIYLKDEVKPSKWMKDVEEIIDQKIASGELTQYDKSVILDKWRKVNVTDAQAFRTLKSFRATQIAADMWSDEAETAYNNIRNDKWTASDFLILWNTRKPYLYTQSNQSDGVGGMMRVPTQHKNSEMIMLTQAIFGSILSKAGKFKGLSEFMEDNDIDVAMFGTAVKVGGQGLIDLNGIDDIKSVKNRLNDIVFKNGKINNEIVHEFDWDDYGIQVATPDHGVDAPVLVGIQMRRLIGTDISPDAELRIGDKTLTREQWKDYFNAVNTANIREAFERLDKTFSDPKNISDLLISEIKSNPRYSDDLIEAVSLNENGQFNIPLFDPAQSQKIQELLNSIIKSRIVKQKIAGASLIQASAWALNEKDRPQIVWDTDSHGNKRIKYIEAYVACPDSRLYELLLEKDGSLNINKKDSKGNYILPDKYREAIGYRIPTEDKYSMIPIRIKGFLPRQVGSVIILPEEITVTTGSDFDVDKIYLMYHTLSFNNVYDVKSAWDDFYTSHPDVVSAIEESKRENFNRAVKEALENNPEADMDDYDLDDMFRKFVAPYKNYEWVDGVQESFTQWFNPIKDRYLVSKAVRAVTYNEGDVDISDSNKNRKTDIYNQSKKNSKEQRDSMMIDLMWSVLTNSDTVGKMINPGNFDEQKRDARIMNLLNVLSLDQIESLGGISHILSLSLEDAENMLEKYGKTVNPLTPDTWIEYQQRNMSGAALVPMAATQNASHAVTQLTSSFGLSPKYRLTFNGRTLDSLHSVKSVDNKFISKNVCSYLAAFVDNAKDPVAGDLNINNTTANLAFLLLRLGNSPMTTSLILRQPAMMRVMRYVNTGRYSVGQAVKKSIEDYIKQGGSSFYGGKIEQFNFTDTWLASNISAEKGSENNNSSHEEEHDFASRQLKVLDMLKLMLSASDALGDVVRAVRSDSQSGGAGGTIAQTMDKTDRVLSIIMKSSKDENYPLTGLDFLVDMVASTEENDVVSSPLPVQTAMYQWGLESLNKWYRNLFPQVSSSFRDVADMAKSLTAYGNLDADTINRIYSHYVVYLMTGASDDFTGDQETRNYFINKFPMEFNEFKKANPGIVDKVPLLKRLQVLYSNKYNGSPSIVFKNVGKVTSIQSDGFMSDFRHLLSNDSTRELASKLFRYSFYRGLGFSPSGFSNFIPSQMKMSDVTDYVKSLRSILNMESDNDHISQFMYQYIRNNLNDRKFVPEVSMSGVLKSGPVDSFSVAVSDKSSQDMKRFVYPIGDDGVVKYREFICYTYNGVPNYYQYDSNDGMYKKVSPLGSSQYQEYDYNSLGSLMQSSVQVSENKGFNLRDDYQALNIFNDNDIQDGSSYMELSDNNPGITLEDLYGKQAGMSDDLLDQMNKMDEQFSEGLSMDDMSSLESLYKSMMEVDPVSNDLEGNKKCD